MSEILQPTAPMNAMELMKKKQTASKLSPLLEPGTHRVFLREIELTNAKYGIAGENKQITLTLETAPLGGEFEGFFKDPNNTSLGRYQGRIATVSLSRWAFSDFKTRSGKIISQEDSMFRALREFYIFLWGNEEDVKYDREKYDKFISYFYDVRDFLMQDSLEIIVTLGGAEYYSKNDDKGYVKYNLFLPVIDKENETVSASALLADGTTVMPVTEFDASVHVIKAKKEEDKKAESTVASFGAPSAPGAPGSAPAAPGSIAPGAPGSAPNNAPVAVGNFATPAAPAPTSAPASFAPAPRGPGM